MKTSFYLVVGIFLLGVFDPGRGADANKVSEISQYGITWKFSAPVTAGHYVTGDWWVLAPVTVVSVDPGPAGGLNGSVVNPKAGKKQGYDGRSVDYDPTLVAQFPLDLKGGQSLVRTVSLVTFGEVPPGTFAPKGHKQDALLSAVVLTCVAEVPPDDAFRPAYVGDWRQTYRVSQLRRNLLPGLEPVKTPPNLTVLNRTFERIWLDHKADFTSGYFHPRDNMPEYGREITNAVSDAGMAVLLKNPDETLLLRFVQKGIDYYGTALSNNDLWVANGGHDSGRKWPILFAGILLGDDGMMRVKAAFAEDQQTYYGKRFGSTTDSALWTISPGASNEKDEEFDPATWPTMGKGINNGTRAEGYRHVNGPSWVGQALAARLMGAMDLWNHPAYFDYVDRWMKEGGKAGSPFVGEMWTTYRDQADTIGAATKAKLPAPASPAPAPPPKP